VQLLVFSSLSKLKYWKNGYFSSALGLAQFYSTGPLAIFSLRARAWASFRPRQLQLRPVPPPLTTSTRRPCRSSTCAVPRPYPREAAMRRKFLFCRCSAPRHRVKPRAPLLSSACPLLTGRRRAVPPRHQPGNLPPRARPPPPRVRGPSRQAGDLLRGIPSGFFLLPGRLHADILHRPPSGPADHATSFASSPCGSPTTPTPTSATPPTPHRRFSPLDVRRREAAAVVSLPPPRRLKSSVHPAGNLPDPPPPPVSLSVGRISPASRRRRGRNPLPCFPGWAEMAEGVGPSRPSSTVD
jgi:hypothetical protein